VHHYAMLRHVQKPKQSIEWQITSVSEVGSLSEFQSLHTKLCYPLPSWKSSTRQAGVGIL